MCCNHNQKGLSKHDLLLKLSDYQVKEGIVSGELHEKPDSADQ